jgi:hypothetical protein
VVVVIVMMMLVNMVVVTMIAAAFDVVVVAMPAPALDDMVGMTMIVVTVMGAMLTMGVATPSAITYWLHRRFSDGQ